MSTKQNRRQFLRRSVGVLGTSLALPNLIPSTALGKDGAVAASEKITVGFIGTDGWVGNTGWRGKVQASSDEILNSVIGPDEVKLFTNPAGEHRNFLDCVKSRQDPYFPVDIGHRVATVCHLANLAIKLGRKLKWNPEKEHFVDDAEADSMMSRPMREPWTLA